MKLTKKLIVILSASLAAAFLAVSLLAFWQMRSQSISVAVDNYDRQMDSISYAFSEIGTREDFEAMGDIAAEAYLKYQFRKCYKNGYALLKGEECIVNLTDFEILDPGALEGPYKIQRLGKKAVLLMKREISQFPGYDVLMAQNITPYYQEIERRGIILALLCAGVWALTAAAALFMTHKALKPLKELTRAAVKIGNGSLGERVPVNSRDEIGEFAGAFNQMTEKVEKQVEDLELLLGALAHEIKTPMTAVIGYSESLLHVKLSEEQKKRSLEQIHDAGLRLERLSSKMLSLLGRYENEEVRFETLRVWELIDAAVKETEPLWSAKKVVIEKKPVIEKKLMIEKRKAQETELWIQADRELFLSLLFNLIHNAVKASKPGGKIRIEAGEDRIVITDEGCGIPARDLPHVTEAFYMADKSRSRNEGGSGLGLALCEKIASLHGVRIEIKSRHKADGFLEEECGTQVILHCNLRSGGKPQS
ncbi:HAMP domain-containing sensor histidine kinase [[Clostridium] symbiosum]|uniref:sensor histidine kinase n=1 Tax=Clostridium symbiosum TaxID=1512 RepID=UPI001D08E8CE|nr:HAMP domain-containing sensor histidine kinase [[Clostridium] symbiosum]MCB6608590.1 HAMP domain-containing histidine kinase [[Clostridium] symbiosum]MCB6931718.1 HAMP domain-containing histidine kinase [[Clostridium] symbiosum]